MAKIIKFQVGKSFSSYEDLINFKKKFEDESFCQLFISHSRSIESARKRGAKRYLNSNLKYYEVCFRCIHAGSYKSRSKGERHSQSSMKTGCPAFIYLHCTADGRHLEVRKLNECHNHEISEEAFKRLPQQRKLPPDVKKSAKEMLALDVNKRKLLQKLQQETGKMLTMKDLRNLAYEKKHERVEEIVLLQETNVYEDVAETNAYEDVAETYAYEDVAENIANEPVMLDHNNYEEEVTTNEPVSQEDGDKIVFIQKKANSAVEDLVREKKRSNDLKERLLEEARKRNAYLDSANYVQVQLLEETRRKNAYLEASNDVQVQLLEESRRRNNYLELLLKRGCINCNQSFAEPMQT